MPPIDDDLKRANRALRQANKRLEEMADRLAKVEKTQEALEAAWASDMGKYIQEFLKTPAGQAYVRSIAAQVSKSARLAEDIYRHQADQRLLDMMRDEDVPYSTISNYSQNQPPLTLASLLETAEKFKRENPKPKLDTALLNPATLQEARKAWKEAEQSGPASMEQLRPRPLDAITFTTSHAIRPGDAILVNGEAMRVTAVDGANVVRILHRLPLTWKQKAWLAAAVLVIGLLAVAPPNLTWWIVNVVAFFVGLTI
jgi:hypothetical protein